MAAFNKVLCECRRCGKTDERKLSDATEYAITCDVDKCYGHLKCTILEHCTTDSDGNVVMRMSADGTIIK